MATVSKQRQQQPEEWQSLSKRKPRTPSDKFGNMEAILYPNAFVYALRSGDQNRGETAGPQVKGCPRVPQKLKFLHEHWNKELRFLEFSFFPSASFDTPLVTVGLCQRLRGISQGFWNRTVVKVLNMPAVWPEASCLLRFDTKVSHPDLLAKDLAMAELYGYSLPWFCGALLSNQQNIKGNSSENKVVIIKTRTHSKFVRRKTASEAYHQTWHSLAVLKWTCVPSWRTASIREPLDLPWHCQASPGF